MLSLSALSLLLAVSAPGPTQAPPTAAAPFARVYKLKEQVAFRILLNEKVAGDLKAVVQLNVLKFLPKGVPQILLKTTEYTQTQSTTYENPDEQTCLFTAHNVPDSGLKVMHANFVYMFLAVAGATPDKVVKVGDEFPLSISYEDSSVTLKGGGKFTSVDAIKKTATVDWKYAFLMAGHEYGSFAFASVYEQANYCLVKSTGVFDGPGPTHLEVAVERIDPDHKAAK